MKFLIYCTFLLVSLVCNGQNANSIDLPCKLLSLFLDNVTTKREFFLCKDDTEFKIYDQTGYFKNCNSWVVCDKRITKVFDEEYQHYTSNVYKYWNKQDLLIIYNYDADIENAKYVVCVWRPYSGSAVQIEYGLKEGDIEIICVHFGAF